jgi:hypothetical protein
MTAILLAALLLPGGPPAKPTATKAPVKDWKSDPACRLVFHAVLEGLYEDGVSDEVVNNIVPPDKKGQEKMRRSFVLGCPLCQPAFEAFCVYQARPKFSDGSKSSTFGKGLSPTVVKGLMSDTVSTRLITLRGPIHTWVERRLRSMKLSKDEREKWWKDISARAGQGTATLMALKAKDEWYRPWAAYWGCAACKGSEDACRAIRHNPDATPRK